MAQDSCPYICFVLLVQGQVTESKGWEEKPIHPSKQHFLAPPEGIKGVQRAGRIFSSSSGFWFYNWVSFLCLENLHRQIFKSYPCQMGVLRASLFIAKAELHVGFIFQFLVSEILFFWLWSDHKLVYGPVNQEFSISIQISFYHKKTKQCPYNSKKSLVILVSFLVHLEAKTLQLRTTASDSQELTPILGALHRTLKCFSAH